MDKYPEMKKSGVPWADTIPSSWSVRRGKTILALLNRPIKDDDEIITCFRDGEVTLRKNRREEGFTVALQENGYQGIEPGDLVVHGMDGFAGAIGISDSRGKATPVLNVMESSQNKKFLMYYLRALAYKDVFMSLSTGIRVRSCDLRWNKLAVLPFIIPSLPEQAAIVSYLDDQLAQIDSIITEALASIEEYKQWKACIVFEAVTRGINSREEFRSTGNPWIDTLPHGIRLSRLGLHFDITLGKMLCPNQLDSSYTLEPYYCAANVHFNGVDESDLKEMWFSVDEKEKYRVMNGDLLVVEGGAGAGGCSIARPLQTTYVQNSIMIVRPRRKSDVRYVKYLLEMLVKRGYIDFACNRATIPHFTKEKLSNVPFPVFPDNEIIEICNHVDEWYTRIDEMIETKTQLILDLEAYKRSLIYETVTGKRKVV